MSGLRYRDPARVISGSTVYPGGTLAVYATGTDERAAIFADAARSVRIQNPRTADSAGRLPAIYISRADEDAQFDIVLRNRSGVQITTTTIDLIHDPVSLDDNAPRSDNGQPLAFATRTFYQADTTQLASIFEDSALEELGSNPQTADSGGEFDAAWLDVTKGYRVILRDEAGRLLYDIGNVGFLSTHVAGDAPVLSGENVDDTSNSLSWTEPASPNPIVGYRLYNADDDTLIVDQPGRMYLHEGLTNDTQYSYYVVAYTALTVSAHSNIIELQTGHPDIIIDTFLMNGTWTKRANLLSIDVIGRGSGAGGASNNSGHGGAGFAGGGGGGGYFSFSILESFLASTVAVGVGLGGSGGPSVQDAGGIVGEDGGVTAFGAWAATQAARGGHYTGTGAPGFGQGGTAEIPDVPGPTSKVTQSGGNGAGVGSAPGSAANAGGGGGASDGGSGGAGGIGTGGTGGANVDGGTGSAGGTGGAGSGGGGGGSSYNNPSIPGEPSPQSGGGGAGGPGRLVVINHLS